MIPLKTEWQALTDTGLVREVNEDRYCASDTLGLWAVADGMGGMARGDWAAGTLVDALNAVPRHEDAGAMVAATADAIQQANQAIVIESAVRGVQMGTTIVALVIRDRQFTVMWVGDSRAYLRRDGQLHPLTRDHSQVQELVDRGVLDPAMAATHPLRNVITRAVGIGEPLTIDAITDTLLPDDQFLLCSDGLHGVVDDGEIAAILAQHDATQAARALVDRCHALGAPDNVTLVLVTASESTLVRFGSELSRSAT